MCLGCAQEGALLCSQCFASIACALSNHCAFCEKATLFGNTCLECSKTRFLDGAISCVPYSHPLILEMLHAWKYDSQILLTDYFGKFVLMCNQKAILRSKAISAKILQKGIAKKDISSDAIVPALLCESEILLQPIPLHPSKEKERGFNQAKILADFLARNNEQWAMADFLERAKKTEAQATLGTLDRRYNAKGAFVLRKNSPTDIIAKIKGSHIAIIDDVITAGSTADECARVLKCAGAASVWALTIAYGHPVKK